MKHVAIDYHFIQDQVQHGALRVAHVSSEDQLADALNKSLPRGRFHNLKINYEAIKTSSAISTNAKQFCGGNNTCVWMNLEHAKLLTLPIKQMSGERRSFCTKN